MVELTELSISGERDPKRRLLFTHMKPWMESGHLCPCPACQGQRDTEGISLIQRKALLHRYSGCLQDSTLSFPNVHDLSDTTNRVGLRGESGQTAGNAPRCEGVSGSMVSDQCFDPLSHTTPSSSSNKSVSQSTPH